MMVLDVVLIALGEKMSLWDQKLKTWVSVDVTTCYSQHNSIFAVFDSATMGAVSPSLPFNSSE